MRTLEQEVRNMIQKPAYASGSQPQVSYENRTGAERTAEVMNRLVSGRRKRSVVQGGMFNHSRKLYRYV